jgi:hypothetical protein
MRQGVPLATRVATARLLGAGTPGSRRSVPRTPAEWARRPAQRAVAAPLRRRSVPRWPHAAAISAPRRPWPPAAHHRAQLIEHVVVREARVAVVERLEAVHEPKSVERGQAVLGGVRVVEVHLGQLVGGEDAVTVEHGQDRAVPFRQPVRHRHHEPVGGPRPQRRSVYENTPKESGFATGGGGVAARCAFGTERVLRSGLATLLAGALATAVATRWIPLTPSTPHGEPWCADPTG